MLPGSLHFDVFHPDLRQTHSVQPLVKKPGQVLVAPFFKGFSDIILGGCPEGMLPHKISPSAL
jgi:hypothetical protein